MGACRAWPLVSVEYCHLLLLADVKLLAADDLEPNPDRR